MDLNGRKKEYKTTLWSTVGKTEQNKKWMGEYFVSV